MNESKTPARVARGSGLVRALIEQVAKEIERRVRAEVMAEGHRREAGKLVESIEHGRKELVRERGFFNDLQRDLERTRAYTSSLARVASDTVLAAQADLAEAWRWIEYAGETIPRLIDRADRAERDAKSFSGLLAAVRGALGTPDSHDIIEHAKSLRISNAQRMDRAAADERERCAKICEALAPNLVGQASAAATLCADRIRRPEDIIDDPGLAKL